MNLWVRENWFNLAVLVIMAFTAFSYIIYLNSTADRNYYANKKNDCLSIFKVEDDRWNNVESWRYSERYDICYIEYEKDGDSFENEF